jgi:hypothetical protein
VRGGYADLCARVDAQTLASEEGLSDVNGCAIVTVAVRDTSGVSSATESVGLSVTVGLLAHRNPRRRIRIASPSCP